MSDLRKGVEIHSKLDDAAKFCAKIMEASAMFPHLRIGQLIVNAITYNLYNIDDEALIEALQEYMKMYDPKR